MLLGDRRDTLFDSLGHRVPIKLRSLDVLD
jgi:hypothetical protein